MKHSKINKVNLFETGLYTIGDVARLAKTHPKRISRWMRGYTYASSKGRGSNAPLWVPEIPPIMNTISLSFNDLIEILLVHEFREDGVPLPKIRSTIIALRKETKSQYPFSNKMIFTNGKDLFEKLLDEDGRPLFFQRSAKRQHYSFFSVTLPFLRKGFVFDEAGLVRRWFPDRKRFHSIVIDPGISFGRPVIDGTRLNTSVLASVASSGRTADDIAEWFGIKPELVNQAILFHEQFKLDF